MGRRRGFTVLETMIAFTLLIILVVNFMTGTNVEIGTVTGQSIAHERCSTVLAYLATDVRGAKRGTLLFPDRTPITAFTFMKYVDNKDERASDKVVVQQVTYRFEAAASRLARYATPVRWTGEKFEKAGETEERGFDHVSGFEVTPGSSDGTRDHVAMLGFKVSSAVENKAVGHAQVSTAQTIVYLRDENYFEKQPKWNENALYTSSLVSLTFGKQNLPDFSEFTAAAKWIGDIATKFPDMVGDVGKQVFEETRQKLAARVHEESDRLRREFLSGSSVDAVIRRAREKAVEKIWKSMDKKPHVAAAAMFLKDAFYDGANGKALRERIAERKITAADLAKYIGNQCDTGLFSPYRLPKVSKEDLENLAAWEKDRSGNEARAASTRAAAEQLKQLIYQGAAAQKDFDLLCGGFVQVMTDTVTERIRDSAKAILTDDLIGKTVGGLVDTAKTNLMENLGLDKALQTANLHPRVREEIDRLVGNLDVNLLKIGTTVKGTVRKEIDQGHGEPLPNFAADARASVASANASGQQAVKDLDIRKVADSMKDMPDPVNGAIINVADQILSGRVWDGKTKDFVDDPKATNFIDKIWIDFGLKPPRSTGV